jgi:hypothetical protein
MIWEIDSVINILYVSRFYGVGYLSFLYEKVCTFDIIQH